MENVSRPRDLRPQDRGRSRAVRVFNGVFPTAFAWKGLLFVFLLGGLLMAGAPVARAQVSIGIQIGAPPPPRVLAVIPSRPGPDFVWIEGYWYPAGKHYKWHDGYWTRPPYAGARWVAPHHDGERYFNGYWDGDHGRFDHDHNWDHDHERDSDRWHDHDDHGHDHDDRDHHEDEHR